MEAGDSTSTSPAPSLLARAYPRMKEAGGGKIIQHRLDAAIFGAPPSRRLRRLKGGNVQLHKVARLRLGQGQHPGQRRAAGLDDPS